MSANPKTCGNKSCTNAGSGPIKLSKCAACTAIHYCSRSCQKSDWKRHKVECKKLRKKKKSKRKSVEGKSAPVSYPGQDPYVSDGKSYTTDGKLREQHAGLLDNMLMLARYETYKKFGTNEPGFGSLDFHKFYSIPRSDHRLMEINYKMYSYWNYDVSGQEGSGVYKAVERAMAENNGDISDVRESAIYLCKKYAKSWAESRVTGTFYVYKDTPEGSILIREDLKDVYCVLGMADNIADLLLQEGPLPQKVRATFMPFVERLAYDGMVDFCGSEITTQLRKGIKQVYKRACEEGKVIKKIDVPEPDIEKLFADEKQQEVKVIKLTKRQKLIQQNMKALTERGETIIYRRLAYTEEENPNHILIPTLGTGFLCEPVFMSGVEPTTKEILDSLKKTTQEWNGKPNVICVDHREIVDELSAILKPAGIVVLYYPPPGAEESRLYDQCE